LARLASVLDGPTLERLRASRRLQQRCQRLRHWHDRLQRSDSPRGGPSLEALDEADRLQLHRQLEEDLPALLMPLDPAAARAAMERWRNPADRLFHPRPPLDGRRLQQLLAIAPGPRLGQLIDHLTAEWAFGRLGVTAATETAELADQALVGETIAAAQLWLGRQREAREADPRRD
jgi:tRNA nucleotidyltransferase (CCA-adding enzyme)